MNTGNWTGINTICDAFAGICNNGVRHSLFSLRIRQGLLIAYQELLGIFAAIA